MSNQTAELNPCRVDLERSAVERVFNWFLWSAGAVLLLCGLDQIAISIRQNQALNFHDPVFGIPFRFVLLSIGSINLAVAMLFLFARRKKLPLGLSVWLGINLLVYRMGMSHMGWPEPYPFVCNLTALWGLSPQLAGVIQTGIIGYLLLGGLAGSIALRQGFSTGASLKMSCPTCGGHIKFASGNLGQKILCPHCQAKIALRQPDESLKTACYFCKGHIEFPAHALGTKMPCPHCKKDITLLEPKPDAA